MRYTKKTYDPAVAERKAKNEKIFKETTADIQRGWYRTPSGHTWSLDYTMIDEGSRCYHDELPPVTGDQVPGGTKIVVLGEDCLVTAERLVGRDYNPALLNFASGGHPGGGVETGARAQEETICRRSTLTRSIYTFDANYAKRFGYPHHEGANYPLDNLNFSAIYSPGVTVFREGKECTYMEHPYSVAVITCAALNLNGRFRLKLTPDKRMPEEAIAITRNKVRTIFRIALLHGHDSLVLGAFGCGAFKNPPEQVAAIFHEVLEEAEFKDRFRVVTFSIIEDHNSKNRNLFAFQQEFSNTGHPEKQPAPDVITRLSKNQVFVFGSNLQGAHAGGAAHAAVVSFGAVWGQGVGLQGQSYAIPTMQGPVETIKPYVDEFTRFAAEHPELEFLVTRIGCGIAGFKDYQIAPLFKDALSLDNVRLPQSFLQLLQKKETTVPTLDRTTHKEKLAEAVERMRHIGMDEEYIKALGKGEIMVYDPDEEPELIGDREEKEIQQLEKRYGMFVWGVLRDNDHNEDWVDGDPVNVYLFVWDDPKRWAEEREALYEMKPLVYVSFANPEEVDGFYDLESAIAIHKDGYPVLTYFQPKGGSAKPTTSGESRPVVLSPRDYVNIFPFIKNDKQKEELILEIKQNEIDLQIVTADEKRLREILESVGREGTEDFLHYLKINGFFTAPASVSHHNNWKGGLVNHSLKVYNIAMGLREEMVMKDPELANSLNADNIAVAALLHDVCKIDEYKTKADGTPAHKMAGVNLGGHGYKSVVMILYRGYKLEGEEILAIRWHMGAKRIIDPKEKAECEKAKKDSALVRLIIQADHEAATKY